MSVRPSVRLQLESYHVEVREILCFYKILLRIPLLVKIVQKQQALYINTYKHTHIHICDNISPFMSKIEEIYLTIRRYV
jgi:hypothetical protein